MRWTRFLLMAGLACAVAACDDDDNGPTDDETSIAGDAWYEDVPNATPIRVYQHNTYPGFNVDEIIGAALTGDQQLFLGALANGLETFLATDWDARAALIATEVKKQQPDVITLNEMPRVSWRGLTVFAALANEPAFADFTDQTTDFLPVLQEKLAAEGLDYTLVSQLRETRVPVVLIPDVADLEFWDSDVMLVRTGLAVTDIDAELFAARTPPLALGEGQEPFEIVRGWIGADVTVNGIAWRVIVTHPESQTGGSVLRDAQIAELLAVVAAETELPVVLAGDLNFQPDETPYADFTGAGLVDLWTLRGDSPLASSTCCHDDALNEATPMLDQRIDYVWARVAPSRAVGAVRFTLFGDETSERTDAGLWPSDHLGLAVGLAVVPD
jgi:endonuclease/exonuclease/phosphatase family metal-dependent hydrolase